MPSVCLRLSAGRALLPAPRGRPAAAFVGALVSGGGNGVKDLAVYTFSAVHQGGSFRLAGPDPGFSSTVRPFAATTSTSVAGRWVMRWEPTRFRSSAATYPAHEPLRHEPSPRKPSS